MIVARDAEPAVKTVLGVPTPIMESVRGDIETPGRPSAGTASDECVSFQALLGVAELIGSCRDLEELFRRLATDLRRVVTFDFLCLVLHERERGLAKAWILETSEMVLAPRPDIAMEDTPAASVIETQQPVVVADTAAETRWPRLMAELRRQGIASFCSVPLTTARRRLGTLGFGLRSHIAYRASDVAFMGQVAKLVAVAVENALNFGDAQAMQGELSAERDHLRLLLEVTNVLVSKLDLPDLISAISSSLQRAIPHELTSLDLPDNGNLVVRSVAFKTLDGKAQEGRRLSIEGTPPGHAFATRRTQVFGEDELLTRFPEVTEPVRELGIRSLCSALQKVEVVAPPDSTVLLLGEPGTGKDLIARAIHDRSSRRERTFVKINCAAIPSGLLESELFGHEKGAFTGAIAQKIGRFQVADGGTLFLDEIGEIPLELQPKLLRVLQEQEFERLGGTRTIKVHVRLIAATNRDLAGMVEERCFRDDLYYRLNVFPIAIPPLREQPEDIDALVDHFVGRFARRLDRHIDVIPSETREALRHHPWPGNVRELENVIQRAVILSPGGRLTLPPLRVESPPRPAHNEGETLEGVERAYVARVLEETRW